MARRAKVSRATVSYVLNGVATQKISDKTRDAVQRAAEELGYRPNLAARSLAAGTSRIALLVVPSIHLGDLAALVSSYLTARAAEHGVTLIVHFNGPASRSVLDVAKDLRPRAVFAMFGLDSATSRELEEIGIAVVPLMQNGGAGAPVGDPATWLQVEHLIANGYTRIACADTADPALEMVAESRRIGVAEACRRHGLAAPLYGRFALGGEDAADTVRRWARAGVDAVAAYNDEVAITVLAGIRRAGLRCPEDIAVIGVDEMAINASMDPPLSSIEYDIDTIARMYADALPAMLDGRTTPSQQADIAHIMRVVERASTVRQARD